MCAAVHFEICYLRCNDMEENFESLEIVKETHSLGVNCSYILLGLDI